MDFLRLLVPLVFVTGCGGRMNETPPAPQDSGVSEVVDVPEPGFDVPTPDVFGPLEELSLEPSRTTLFIDLAGGGSKPATQTYKAILHREDGTVSDVTPESTFEIDPAFGLFTGATLTTVSGLPPTMSPGFSTGITGTYGARKGYAKLILVELDLSKDLFFVSPYNADPDPTRAVLRARAGTTPLDVRLALTPKVGTVLFTTSELVKTVRAMGEGNSKFGCAPRAAKDVDGDGTAETFVSVEPGASVCFEVTPARNITRKGSDYESFFTIFADVIGAPGDVSIERHALVFMVPARPPRP